MKKIMLFTTVLLSLFMCVSFNCSAFRKHVDVTITTTSGCKVHIVGDVTYTLVPPAITGFTGTVSIGPPCPKTTLTFGMAADGGGEAEIALDSDNPCNLSEIRWSTGDNDLDDILNSLEVNDALVFELSILCEP